MSNEATQPLEKLAEQVAAIAINHIDGPNWRVVDGMEDAITRCLAAAQAQPGTTQAVGDEELRDIYYAAYKPQWSVDDEGHAAELAGIQAVREALSAREAILTTLPHEEDDG